MVGTDAVPVTPSRAGFLRPASLPALFGILVLLVVCWNTLGCGNTGTGDPVLAPPRPGSVAGRLWDGGESGIRGASDRGRTLPGALVFLEDQPAILASSAPDGSFLLTGLPAGMPQFLIAEWIASDVVMKGRLGPVSVEAGQTTVWPEGWHLRRAVRRLSGTVGDEHGRPVSGVAVTVWGRTSTTDGQGRFAVGPHPAELTDIRFTAPDGRIVTISETFATEAPVERRIVLPAGSGANRPPSLDVRPDRIVTPPGAVVAFQATVTDPDGDPVVMTWGGQYGAGSGRVGIGTGHLGAPTGVRRACHCHRRGTRRSWGSGRGRGRNPGDR